MHYLDYEKFKQSYHYTQKKYDELLNMKALSVDNEEIMDKELLKLRTILDEKEYLLGLKEKELRASKNVYDRIYVYRFIEFKKMRWIAYMVSYSQAQIYRFIDVINEEIEKIRS